MSAVTSWFRYQKPPSIRVVISITYIAATAGLLILAFNPDLLFDQWAIVGASVITLVLLMLILWTGHGFLWLGVGGAWIYAAIMEMERGPSDLDRIGLSLVFVAFAFGGLAAYTAYRREAPLRI